MPDPEERTLDEAEMEPSEEVSDDEPSASISVPVPSVSESGEDSAVRELIEFIARALAANPDAVQVTEEDDGGRTVYRLLVDEKDKGKIIGRDGRVAQSIRSLLRVAATKSGTRVTLEID